MTILEQLDTLRAAAAGKKTIQIRLKHRNEAWLDLVISDQYQFDFVNFEYHIKPEACDPLAE